MPIQGRATFLASDAHGFTNMVRRFSSAPWHWWLALYVAGFLNLPVYWRRFEQIHQLSDGTNALLRVGLEATLVCAVSCLFIGIIQVLGQWMAKLLSSVFLIASVVASYYMTFFQVVIGFGVVQAVLTTDVDLSKESVGFGLVAWVGAFAFPWLWMIWRSKPVFNRWRDRVGSFVLGIGIAAVLFALSYLALRQWDAPNKEAPDSVMIKPEVLVAHTYVPSNWLAGLAMSLSNDWSQWRNQKSLRNPATMYAYQANTPLDDVIVVLVIGESARSPNFGLFGYERNTTPRLSQLDNLVAFRGQSCNTSTKLSLQCMFVRPAAVTEQGMNQPVVSELPVFSVLKKLGFSIDVLAMQSEVWFYNSVMADFYKIREVIAAAPNNVGKPSHDGLLLDEMAERLATKTKKPKLVILHTKGSHYLYTSRYPRSFARYQPECKGIDQRCSHAQLINSYDNSILYLDYFLTQLTTQLQDKKALLIYTSDHGESIGENLHFHATPKPLAPPEQVAVPLMVWASPEYLKITGMAKKLKALQAVANTLETDPQSEKVGHHNLFDTILGCLAVVSIDGGLQDDLNLCR